MKITPRRQLLLIDIAVLSVLAAAGVAAGLSTYARLSAPRVPDVASLPPPTPSISPVPHPRCFPEGTAGAADFRLCPDGLIDNPRSI